MSNTQVIRKKLAMLRKSPAKELLYDAIKMYVEEVEGMSPSAFLSLEADGIATELEKMYLSQIPKKQKKVQHKDLETLIQECKDEKANGK